MIDDTINDDKTIAGGGGGAVLAGRYKIIRPLGCSGWVVSLNLKMV